MRFARWLSAGSLLFVGGLGLSSQSDKVGRWAHQSLQDRALERHFRLDGGSTILGDDKDETAKTDIGTVPVLHPYGISPSHIIESRKCAPNETIHFYVGPRGVGTSTYLKQILSSESLGDKDNQVLYTSNHTIFRPGLIVVDVDAMDEHKIKEYEKRVVSNRLNENDETSISKDNLRISSAVEDSIYSLAYHYHPYISSVVDWLYPRPKINGDNLIETALSPIKRVLSSKDTNQTATEVEINNGQNSQVCDGKSHSLELLLTHLPMSARDDLSILLGYLDGLPIRIFGASYDCFLSEFLNDLKLQHRTKVFTYRVDEPLREQAHNYLFYKIPSLEQMDIKEVVRMIGTRPKDINKFCIYFEKRLVALQKRMSYSDTSQVISIPSEKSSTTLASQNSNVENLEAFSKSLTPDQHYSVVQEAIEDVLKDYKKVLFELFQISTSIMHSEEARLWGALSLILASMDGVQIVGSPQNLMGQFEQGTQMSKIDMDDIFYDVPGDTDTYFCSKDNFLLGNGYLEFYSGAQPRAHRALLFAFYRIIRPILETEEEESALSQRVRSVYNCFFVLREIDRQLRQVRADYIKLSKEVSESQAKYEESIEQAIKTDPNPVAQLSRLELEFKQVQSSLASRFYEIQQREATLTSRLHIASRTLAYYYSSQDIKAMQIEANILHKR